MAIYIDSDDIKTFTAYTAEAVSAGNFVKATGSTEIATTTAIDTADLIQVMMCNANGDEDTAVGICMEDAADNTYATIRTQMIGRFKVDSTNGSITAGATLQVSEGTDPDEVELYDVADGGKIVGYALTPADDDDEYVLAVINFGGAINA